MSYLLSPIDFPPMQNLQISDPTIQSPRSRNLSATNSVTSTEVGTTTVTGDSDPALASYNLGLSQQKSYRKHKNAKDRATVIESFKTAINLTPPENSGFCARVNHLASALRRHYNMTGDIDDLKMSIQNYRIAIEHTPRGDPLLPVRLHSLAASLKTLYDKSGHLHDLNMLVDTYSETARQTPTGDNQLAYYLDSLAEALTTRFDRLGVIDDLAAALENNKAAVELTFEGNSELPGRLEHLATSFMSRYTHTGSIHDLEAAVENNEKAVRLTPQGDPDLPGRMQSLAVAYSERYDRLGDLLDLETAIQMNHIIVDITPKDDPELADRLETLAVSLTNRFTQVGDIHDLEAALEYNQEAVRLSSGDDPEFPSRLESLGMSFVDRYNRLGDLDDLNAGLKNNHAAVTLTPAGHPELAGCQESLGTSYAYKYKRLWRIEDLEAAIENNKASVQNTPKGHVALPSRLESLALALTDRYARFGDLNDLNAALSHNKAAVMLTPDGHPDLSGHLESLAVSLSEMYNRSRNIEDLEAAVENIQESVRLTSQNHSERCVRLQRLSLSLAERYKRLSHLDDLEGAMLNYSLSFETHLLKDPVLSWNSALEWASFAREHKPSECLKAYSIALQLLPDILWIGSSLNVRQDNTRRINITEAASHAITASIDLCDLKLGIELLEQGLATTFQQLLQLKTSVDGLPEAEGKRLKNISAKLYDGTASNPHILSIERNDLVENIRKRPGFEYFLQPTPYKVLCQASKHGPIIILNSNTLHCDAIILLHPESDPIHVPLPNVTLEGLTDQQDILKDLLNRRGVSTRSDSTRLFAMREAFRSQPIEVSFQDFLSWLWTRVVEIIYCALELNNVHSGRIWWCPTGAFTGLPLHAAAPIDQFIQSYTPTLGTLLDTHSKTGISASGPQIGIVGVTHKNRRGDDYLPEVNHEVSQIVSIIGEKQVKCLVGEEATVKAVKHQLEHCSWMHLACHGRQDDLDPPEFVFLSASQTAMGSVELTNESFHLVGGFIAAGFRGAIGTMWSMQDADGPLVSGAVYTHLFRQGQPEKATDAAEALQLAVRKLRDTGVSYERWVPFIHMGL